MSRNNSSILAEQPLNFIHWKPKMFNTSFYDTLLDPNKPDSLANLDHRDKTTFLLADENRQFCLHFCSRCQGIINKPRDFGKKM